MKLRLRVQLFSDNGEFRLLYFREPTKWTMVVADGLDQTPVATARKITSGWLLFHAYGSWIDPRIDRNHPHYLIVKKKGEARELMKSLLDVGKMRIQA